MHSLSRSISHLTLALVAAVALLSTGLAQEVASVDLTKIEARIDLRRPTATSPLKGGYIDIAAYSCNQPTEGALRVSLVSLEHYQVGRYLSSKLRLRIVVRGQLESRFLHTWPTFNRKIPPRSSPT